MTTASIEEQARRLRLSDGDLQEEYHPNNNVTNGVAESAPNNDGRATTPYPFRFVPLTMGGNGRTHVVSEGSRNLILSEVSLKDLQRMTELFYTKAFQDVTLDPLIRSHSDPHGARFAKWIHQKLSGSHKWDRDRQTRDLTPVTVAGGRQTVVHDRSSAHAAAWYSPKRPKEHVGRHFKLDECRVWMRLHFWALRESGLMELSPSFADYYVRFISHFVRVYETMAPAFARDSLRWSADPKNIERYLKNGRRMKEVLGISVSKAMKQIPDHELNDHEWPYNQAPATVSETDDSDNGGDQETTTMVEV